MDGDIEEIEQFLNQIELLVQSRSPLGRKTADELFKRLKALEHECENESDKDRLANRGSYARRLSIELLAARWVAKYHNARNRSVCCSGWCFGALVLGFLASAGNNLFPPASGRGCVFSRLTERWPKKQVAPPKGVV